MTEQTVDIDKQHAAALAAYSAEIMPRIREIDAKKEQLKEYKEANDVVVNAQQAVKNAQEALASLLAADHNVSELTQEIQALSKELTLAIKAASKAVGKKYKVKELKDFFIARAKEKVKPTVAKGQLFSTLDSTLATAAV